MALDPALNDTFDAAAKYYDLDPNLVKSVAGVESGGDPRAVSPKGAVGEMQLVPKTAAEMGVTDLTDPVQSIWGGARYLTEGIAKGEQLAAAGQSVDPLTYGLMYYHGGPVTSGWGPVTQAYPGLVYGRLKRLMPGADDTAAGGDGGSQPPAAPADDGLTKLTRAGTPATTDTGLPPYLLQIERDANAAAQGEPPATPPPGGRGADLDKLATVGSGAGGGGPQLGPAPGQENLFAPVSMDTGAADGGLPPAPSGLETRLGGASTAAATPGGPPPSGTQAPPVSFPGAPPAPAAAAPGRPPGTVPPMPSPEMMRPGAAPAAAPAGGGESGGLDQPPPNATPLYDLEAIRRDAFVPGEGGDAARAALANIMQNGMPYSDGRLYPVPGQQEATGGKAYAQSTGEAGGRRAVEAQTDLVPMTIQTPAGNVDVQMTRADAARYSHAQFGGAAGGAAVGGAPGPAPAGPAPAAPPTLVPGGGGAPAPGGIQLGGKPVQPLGFEQATAEVNNLNTAATNAQDELATIQSMRDVMGRGLKTGWGTDARAEVGRVLTGLGVSGDDVQKLLGIAPADADAFNKQALRLSAQAVRSMGAREPGSVISMFSSAYPSLETQPQALDLMTNMLSLQAQRSQDRRDQVVKSWGGAGGYGGVAQAEADFDRTSPSVDYLHAAEAMTPGYHQQAWAAASPAQQQQILNRIPAGRAYFDPNGVQRRRGGGG